MTLQNYIIFCLQYLLMSLFDKKFLNPEDFKINTRNIQLPGLLSYFRKQKYCHCKV